MSTERDKKEDTAMANTNDHHDTTGMDRITILFPKGAGPDTNFLEETHLHVENEVHPAAIINALEVALAIAIRAGVPSPHWEVIVQKTAEFLVNVLESAERRESQS